MLNGSSITFYPLGEAAIVIKFGETIDEQTNRLVVSFSRHIETCSIPGMIEQVPSLNSITLFYDVMQQNYTEIEQSLRDMLRTFEVAHTDAGRIVEIPVCYGGDFGPDLSHVADYHNLTEEEVIRIHAEPIYLVYMIGFAPGFPYLGGLSEKIATPRRESPRVQIPVGSVGIAGAQTGIYSISTPGGWQLIGRTPTELFQPAKDPPSLLQAGDRVKFIPIARETYLVLKGNEAG
ncbi:MAG: 5-oxoprolinase subunit PxpB [Bacilli bacterium]